MSIPIIIVYGSTTNFDRMGWTARFCTRCNRAQPFVGFDKLRSDHIYFLHGKEKSVGLVLICDFCETSIGLSPNSKEAKALVFTRVWEKSDGLDALVEKTNQQLGRVPVSGKPTRQELFALLESVNERSSPYKIDAGGGFAIGAVIGAVSLPVLFLLLYFIGLLQIGVDAFGMAFMGVILGIFGGGTVGAVKHKFDHSKKLAQEILISAMDRNALTVNTLERALKHYPGTLRYASSGLAALMSGA